MTALNHLPSRLVDVTGQTVVSSSQAAAAAARLAVIVLRPLAMRLPKATRECPRHARDNRCRQRPKEGHA
jgi:hypothetical protein